jgi:uncharacterized protein (DUF2235 family)
MVYSRTTTPYVADEFKYIFARKCPIHFVGVFDSVCSVGHMIPKVLPFTSRNGSVRIFRQALALDEKRIKFDYDPFYPPEEDSRRHGDPPIE